MDIFASYEIWSNCIVQEFLRFRVDKKAIRTCASAGLGRF